MSSATWALHRTSQRTERLAKGNQGGEDTYFQLSLYLASAYSAGNRSPQ